MNRRPFFPYYHLLGFGQVFFAVFYSFNFLFELVLSKNRWVYVCSLLCIVDIATVVPVFLTLAVGDLKNSPTGFVRFYRVVMLSKVGDEAFAKLKGPFGATADSIEDSRLHAESSKLKLPDLKKCRRKMCALLPNATAQ